MPSIFEQNPVYLQSGSPVAEDAATNLYPGQLGARFTVQHPTGRQSPPSVPRTKRFQFVKVEATAAAAPKVGQPAYWFDRANYVVTTVGGTALNQVAGIFNNVATRGNFTCIQFGGPCYVRASDANVAAAVAGTDVLTGGATDLGVLVAGGTAPGVIAIGTVATPKATNTTGGTGNHLILVDLLLPDAV